MRKTQITSEDIPAEVQDVIDELKLNKLMKIEAIGKQVAKKRDEAVTARKQSGIETIWEEDEEYYLGIDDGNRDTHPWTKSAATSGGISREPKKSGTRCTSFFNITRQFVESAAARMGDILLPSGDWNFAVKPTPVQDEDTQASTAVESPNVGNPPSSPVNPDSPNPIQQEAERKARKGEIWIQDKLVECSYHTEARNVIEDAAKLGTGIIKGPYPDKVISKKIVTSNGKTALELVESISPKSSHISPWDAFPDPSCGDNIHNGSYFIERDRLTAKQLENLKGVPGYLSEQIDKVLDEGPSKKNYDDDKRKQDSRTDETDKFEIWYFYGLVDIVSLSALSVKVPEKSKDLIPAVVALVNDTPIQAFLNPLDTGEFPYDFMPWQRTPGSPWGVGVARQGRTAQDMLNAGARAMMDNAGLSSGPQIIMRRNAITPADGKWEISARKVWLATETADIKSVQDAFIAINIPMMQAELNAIIQLAYKMMEDATGIFFIMQGQQGSAPDTVGGMELLHRNASAILRRLARVYDERVTEPHIRRYYEYLLMHGPDDAKGDMKIEAIGSTALVEREIQSMEAMVLLQMSLNPAFGLDPEKAMAEVLKTKRFIPDKWQMDQEKKKSLPPPVIPAIEVAKIRSADLDKTLALEKDKLIANNTLTKHRIDVDTDRDVAYVDAMAERDRTMANQRAQELTIKRELAILDYANRRNISLDQVKSNLAKEAMKLRVQKELTGIAQVAEPAFEPPGRAAPGHAFEQ